MWIGQISDSRCGAVHTVAMAVHTVAMMEKHSKERGAEMLGKADAARECTLACVSDGGKYVFVSEGKIYEIENQGHAGLPEYAGQTVNLTGSIMSANSKSFHPLNTQEKFDYYWQHTFGPQDLLKRSALAGIAQWRNHPPEWEQGLAGYGCRFSSSYGQHAIKKTIQFSIGAALKEDRGISPPRRTDSGSEPVMQWLIR